MEDGKNNINPDKDQNELEHGSQQKKKRRGIRALDIFIILLIIGCAVILCITPYKNWQAGREQDRLRDLAKRNTTIESAVNNEADTDKETASDTDKTGEAPAESEVYISPVDFEELRRVNPDVVAWLTIPGTTIDYPVVQTTDNETYLSKTFEGGSSAAGSVFLDCDSKSSLTGLHSILYGHHMKNKTMFTDLIKFKDEEFFKEHREIILYTPEKEMHLKTVAALYGDSSGERRRTKFSTQEKFNEYVDVQTKDCSFRELPEGDIRHLYSFVTCSYEFEDARTILYAIDQEN